MLSNIFGRLRRGGNRGRGLVEALFSRACKLLQPELVLRNELRYFIQLACLTACRSREDIVLRTSIALRRHFSTSASSDLSLSMLLFARVSACTDVGRCARRIVPETDTRLRQEIR